MKNIFFLLVTVAALATAKPAAAKDGSNTSANTIGNDRCSIALPDMITDFSAVRSNEYAILTWVIQNQEHNDNFIIEKSNDNSHWATCATIPAHGDNTSPAVYFYGDAHPAAITYYRLKQATAEGAAVYTESVKVAGSAKKTNKK